MILVIGAISSGKVEYVKSLGYADSDIANAVMDERPVLNNLQDMVFSDPEGSADLFGKLVQKSVVICNEVGSGIIPAERADRDAREATGRLCNRLAQAAESVVRLVCGIPVKIKG